MAAAEGGQAHAGETPLTGGFGNLRHNSVAGSLQPVHAPLLTHPRLAGQSIRRQSTFWKPRRHRRRVARASATAQPQPGAGARCPATAPRAARTTPRGRPRSPGSRRCGGSEVRQRRSMAGNSTVTPAGSRSGLHCAHGIAIPPPAPACAAPRTRPVLPVPIPC